MNNFPEEIKNLEGKWVALDKDTNEIIAHAATLSTLSRKISHIKDKVRFFKVPDLSVNYVPYGR